MQKKFKLVQVTKDEAGHCLNNTQCFSPDDKWIAFDSRNGDADISKTGSVKMINTQNFKSLDLYETENQSLFGPGVGAVAFSPVSNRVIFIHGIRNADRNKPYGFTRRTGVAIDIDRPFVPIYMDARDIEWPFTPGSLRGGTHAHTWSGDGQWISFTYNDYLLEQLGKVDSTIKDLRTVGVMVPDKIVNVPVDSTGENNSGEMFSVIVAEVTENPLPGSDQINKAFDEGWIGNKGYKRMDGSLQKRAIAFQGNVRKADGTSKTEIFVLDLPTDVTKSKPHLPIEGTAFSRPNVPVGVVQRRLTFSEKGVLGPRHWLRSTPDGGLIGFLSEDKQGIIQVFGVSPASGKIRQLTFNEWSVQGPFNFSPGGESLAYMAGNSVFVTDVKTGESFRVSPTFPENEKPVGAVIWSNQGNKLAFNRYVKSQLTGGVFLQIFLVEPIN